MCVLLFFFHSSNRCHAHHRINLCILFSTNVSYIYTSIWYNMCKMWKNLLNFIWVLIEINRNLKKMFVLTLVMNVHRFCVSRLFALAIFLLIWQCESCMQLTECRWWCFFVFILVNVFKSILIFLNFSFIEF